MINIIDVNNKTIRTFGWVQNPSNFESLKKVVAIFDNTSEIHTELKNKNYAYIKEEMKQMVNICHKYQIGRAHV